MTDLVPIRVFVASIPAHTCDGCGRRFLVGGWRVQARRAELCLRCARMKVATDHFSQVPGSGGLGLTLFPARVATTCGKCSRTIPVGRKHFADEIPLLRAPSVVRCVACTVREVDARLLDAARRAERQPERPNPDGPTVF